MFFSPALAAVLLLPILSLDHSFSGGGLFSFEEEHMLKSALPGKPGRYIADFFLKLFQRT